MFLIFSFTYNFSMLRYRLYFSSRMWETVTWTNFPFFWIWNVAHGPTLPDSDCSDVLRVISSCSNLQRNIRPTDQIELQVDLPQVNFQLDQDDLFFLEMTLFFISAAVLKIRFGAVQNQLMCFLGSKKNGMWLSAVASYNFTLDILSCLQWVFSHYRVKPIETESLI